MTSRTWLLSGLPRSGSSLCCRLAGELPDTVALSEPMRREAFAGMGTQADACRQIEEFARRARGRIPTERRAPSVQVEGRLDDDRVGLARADGRLRPYRGGQGEIRVDKPLSSRFRLLIKHNALFAALLPRLLDSLPCLGLVRNPLAVLASWQTVDLPVHQGRIPAGEQFDAALGRGLEAEPDVLVRQVSVLNWFFGQFGAHLQRSDVLRYEDLVESGGQVLFRRLGHADAPRAPLENRNGQLPCGQMDVDRLLAALVREGGAWLAFYSTADCERVADMIRSAG